MEKFSAIFSSKGTLFHFVSFLRLLPVIGLFPVVILGHEEIVLEKDEIESTDGDAAVREIEHRVKEDASSQKRYPIGPREERKIEHVNHLAEQNRSI